MFHQTKVQYLSYRFGGGWGRAPYAMRKPLRSRSRAITAGGFAHLAIYLFRNTGDSCITKLAHYCLYSCAYLQHVFRSNTNLVQLFAVRFGDNTQFKSEPDISFKQTPDTSRFTRNTLGLVLRRWMTQTHAAHATRAPIEVYLILAQTIYE